MKFCSNCANPLRLGIPDEDNLPRHICDNCETIYYQNPKVITGCLPVYQDKVLLCKRAIEPRKGYWTLPAGFMENNESTMEGALRETYEEANAHVEISHLYTLTSIVHVNQVQLIYLAHLDKPEYAPSNESLEVELFSEKEIPWDDLAFSTIKNALNFYFEDRRTGTYPLHEMILKGNKA
ncbi:NUDIX hydrolase [Neptuniibacter sp. 2_MG-2023]|uniref:NUDIX hydrolase n=1 Tax=Neptuniibacter sp. 2_MG-2023 TaxID=3062671 RepID=UPI0026E2E531|nr:NUDIX hydrolase [Neptuniibacter sp. 2_MG-2023]MDO6513757.1 NUDIX hydrolase [Neptuniibacter sp. 2_MG-2023]